MVIIIYEAFLRISHERTLPLIGFKIACARKRTVPSCFVTPRTGKADLE